MAALPLARLRVLQRHVLLSGPPPSAINDFVGLSAARCSGGSSADISADDYYRVLGVDRGASDGEIAKAYKKLALKHHPDKNPNNKDAAVKRFQHITEAYDVLRDPEKRKQYDHFGKAGLQGPGAGGGAGAEGWSSGPSANMSFERADEIFRMFFEQDSPLLGGLFGGGSLGFQRGGGFGAATKIRRSQARRPSSASLTCVLPPGTEVVVRGLARAPEFNSKAGRVQSWDAARARYDVELEVGMARAGHHTSLEEASRAGSTTRIVAVKPTNLTQRCFVEVVGLTGSPHLNGQRGRISGFDDQRQRYLVRIATHSLEIKLHPGNCLVEPGTCVVVQGLSSAASLNGQMARILEVERKAARYVVRCQSGKTIKIKYDNVIC